MIMTDFDYKKYSLEKLEDWVHDALSGDATPQEIYDTIKNVVVESRCYHKQQGSRAYELLALMNGNKSQSKVEWAHPESSLYKNRQYTEDEFNKMCDTSTSDLEKEKCREYNLREAEYYNQRAQLDAIAEKVKAAGGYEWTPEPKKDRVVKWVLPVQQVKNWVLPPGTKPGSDVDYVLEEDYVINFPDDLLEAADLNEGDTVEWVDQGNGSFLLRKV